MHIGLQIIEAEIPSWNGEQSEIRASFFLNGLLIIFVSSKRSFRPNMIPDSQTAVPC